MELVRKKSINCNQGAIRAVRYNADGAYALTCGSDKKIKLLNPLTETLLKTYGGHGDEVLDVVGSCDSAKILSGSLDKSLIYWDVTTGQVIRRLRHHAGAVNSVKLNEESTVAVSGSRDNTVMCWDMRVPKMEPVQVMNEAKDSVIEVIVANHRIIAASLDGSVRQYDIRAGEVITDSLDCAIVSIARTRDGQCLLLSCHDGIMRLMDNDSGDILANYRGHTMMNYKVECGIICSDSHVVSGSAEGVAVIWELVQGKEIRRIPIGNKVVHSIAVHPTGTDVIFACGQEIHVWGYPY
uniref:WD repeat domain-containing protein 83 n=1 Tax=Phlebotomus papatasi TaxID=29031 RepID=A0A1B0D179_PHLPP